MHHVAVRSEWSELSTTYSINPEASDPALSTIYSINPAPSTPQPDLQYDLNGVARYGGPTEGGCFLSASYPCARTALNPNTSVQYDLNGVARYLHKHPAGSKAYPSVAEGRRRGAVKHGFVQVLKLRGLFSCC